MHLESVAEQLQTGDRVAGSACNFWTQERAGGNMRQDLRIGFKTNKARTSAAVAAAVALIGARITGDGRAAFTSPRLRGEVAPSLTLPRLRGREGWGRVRGPLRESAD